MAEKEFDRIVRWLGKARSNGKRCKYVAIPYHIELEVGKEYHFVISEKKEGVKDVASEEPSDVEPVM